jgi:hypothetical protein
MDSSLALCCRDGFVKWAAVGFVLATVANARAGDFSFESAGARFGAGVGSSNRDFHQAETFVDWNLPWHWDLGKKWDLQSRLDFSAGWVGNNHSDAAVGTVGPLLALGRERFPISLEGGSGPTLISRSEFETRDFGDPVQFTSHIGLCCDLAKHWRLGYRFQHMSNAGISQSNPGLNLHMLALSYRF